MTKRLFRVDKCGKNANLVFLGGQCEVPADVGDFLVSAKMGDRFEGARVVFEKGGDGAIHWMGGKTRAVIPTDVGHQIQDALNGLGYPAAD